MKSGRVVAIRVVRVRVILARGPLSQAAGRGRRDVPGLRRSALLRRLRLRLALGQPVVQVIPLVVGSDQGGGDKVGLRGHNEVALRGRVDLPLSHQHVEGVPQDL